MSQENVDALTQALTKAPEQPDDFFALLDEDVVWDPGTGKVYGRDGVREFFRVATPLPLPRPHCRMWT
jgi:hypothetical protein